jgi:hypothetical protein
MNVDTFFHVKNFYGFGLGNQSHVNFFTILSSMLSVGDGIKVRFQNTKLKFNGHLFNLIKPSHTLSHFSFTLPSRHAETIILVLQM